MRWPEWRWLAAKEWRELGVSRAAALSAVVLGPLTGQAFITAASAYAEASGAGGGPAALAQGLSPLDGLVVPLFGAYALAATLLLPFVAIRSLGADRDSGAWRLLLQSPVTPAGHLTVRWLVLLAAWLAAWVPALMALGWWKMLGGHLGSAETAGVMLGHALHGALVIALAFAAAAVTTNAASAAVVTLAITLGTWALDFVAQVHGGAWQTVAAFTPDAALRVFEHGEVRVALVLVPAVLVVAMLALASIALDASRDARQRVVRAAAVVAGALVLASLAATRRASWDLSEDRRNSFTPAVERALRDVRAPLRITANLAPEDPRLTDLQRGLFHKLERTMPDVRVTVVSTSATGLFDAPVRGYGEVWYELGGARMMSRSTTEPIVLEQLFQLAKLSPPAPDDGAAYSGYPLARTPSGAAWVFYLCWPLAALAAFWTLRRRLGGAAN